MCLITLRRIYVQIKKKTYLLIQLLAMVMKTSLFLMYTL